MSKTEPPMDEAKAREILQRERGRIESALASLESVRENEVDEITSDSDPVDDATSIEAEQVDDAVADQLRTELEALERAEKRLEEGTYGFSVESGEPIPASRLEAVPWAERTPEEQERFRG